MNIAELKMGIVTNSIPNFLVFTGPELEVMNIYIKNILTKLGSSFCVHKTASVKDFIKKSPTKSFFVNKSIYIITDDEDFLKQDNAWDTVKSLTSDNKKLILKYHINDQRLSFWKHFKEDVVVFDKLSDKVLSKNLHKEYGLSLDYCLKLALNCDRDYYRCKLELDKVSTFAKVNKISLEDAFNECFDTVIHKTVEQSIFEFSDALLTKDFSKAVLLYRDIKETEPPIKLLSILYTNFKNVLIAQTIHNAKNIQQNTGINYYQYKKAKDKSGYYSNERLIDILYVIMNLEQGIKSGTIDQEFVINYLICFLI